MLRTSFSPTRSLLVVGGWIVQRLASLISTRADVSARRLCRKSLEFTYSPLIGLSTKPTPGNDESNSCWLARACCFLYMHAKRFGRSATFA